jgi:hypothetical protein
MAIYFFDFRSGDVVSIDDDGVELLDAETTHREALGALGDAISDAALPGQKDQHFAVDVRDEIGPVLQITVVLGSVIPRKQ